jgi:hypothetical protein
VDAHDNPADSASQAAQALYRDAVPGLQANYPDDLAHDWAECEPGEPLLFWSLDGYSAAKSIFSQMSDREPLALVPVWLGDRIVGEYWIEYVDDRWELSNVGGGQAPVLLAAKDDLLRYRGGQATEVRYVIGPLGEWVAAQWDGGVGGMFPFAREAQMALPTITEAEMPDSERVYVDDQLRAVLELLND